MQKIETSAGWLHVSVEGPEGAPAILFANSLGTDFRIWDRVVRLLPAGLRVIRYDKRGHGLSDLPSGAWGMADHVADAAAVLDAAKAGPAVVVGLSIGGMIAQGLAAERPDLTRALALCDTGAKIGTPDLWHGRIAAIEAEGLDSIADGVMERWFSAAYRRDEAGDVAIWRNMMTRTTAAGYVGSCAAIAETDLMESTARLRLPAIALCGDEDLATPPDLVRETIGLIPGGAFHLIRGAGHLPCIDQPEATAQIIGNFLKDIGHG